ncbi:class I SAM-dependent methyltransferase [Actinopolymorpha alba]|uniref:class I SAM-dependent methyltransferase n=1 Tax=Actinopolymorpha alba TaxID=533267 RepID=UPI0003821B9F|nr:class I SAM-dependent methyltransferase [Actinopolymorpha alba]
MEPAEIARFTEVNRHAWDTIALVRGEGLHSGELFAQGEANLPANELPISDWRGLDVLHLQCASGEDTLSLALAGARVTGVDIAPENIRHARRKAKLAGLDATFVAADVYQLPPELLAGGFDVVFLSCGALGWLPDIKRWAGIVTSSLKMGGRLLVDEIHPLFICLEYDGSRYVAVEDYFRRDRPQWNAAGPPGLAGTGPDDIMPGTVEFRWPLGDIITALAWAGMRIELLDEYPNDRPELPAEQQERLRKLPGGFVLLATKDRDRT